MSLHILIQTAYKKSFYKVVINLILPLEVIVSICFHTPLTIFNLSASKPISFISLALTIMYRHSFVS